MHMPFDRFRGNFSPRFWAHRGGVTHTGHTTVMVGVCSTKSLRLRYNRLYVDFILQLEEQQQKKEKKTKTPSNKWS